VDLLIRIFHLVLNRSTKIPQSPHSFGGLVSGVDLVRSDVGRGAQSSGQCTGTLSQEIYPREPWALAGKPACRQITC